MSSYFEDVKEFHLKFGQPAPSEPTPLGWESYLRRSTLMDEEHKEVLEVLGEPDKLPQLGKELADLVYVVLGTAVEAGIPFDDIWKEVQRSNMSKLGEDGKPIYREDGKVLKGPNYSPANVEQFFV